jgi:hypothetical protein
MTNFSETHVRLVRGRQPQVVRFTMTEFPTPRFRQKIGSLYELQAGLRKEKNISVNQRIH